MTNEQLHEFRKQIDACIVVSESENLPGVDRMPYAREMALVRTKLQEAKMWAGKCLEMNGSELPVEFRDKAQ
jgi:hypothetical protein